MTAANGWLDIDIKGFAAVLRNKGIDRIALEPISNALDTDTTAITVLFHQAAGWAELTVTDIDPNGFADLRDAYTLFAPSNRAADPTKRGRFGQGEKELIAICAAGGWVKVVSTSGAVWFDADGRHKSTAPSDRTDAGTRLAARFRCNQREAAAFTKLVEALLVPAGVSLEWNGRLLPARAPARTVTATLPTKVVDSDGNLADSRRQTTVELHEPLPGETPTIYELGVPVVEHDGRWHVNIGQKVPLNTARDNVTPAYLRRVREIMLNETFDLLTEVDVKRPWVADALPKASEEALRTVVVRTFGPDAVIADPSNREATKRAVDDGRSVVYGRSFTPETWARIREHDILRPAGQVIQTGVPAAAPGEPAIEPLGEESWTAAMHAVARYARAVGAELLGFAPTVEFYATTVVTHAGHAVAWWGQRRIAFNLRYLGNRWPDTVSQRALDEILIHEFAHHSAGDHYSDEFVTACCRLGAALRDVEGIGLAAIRERAAADSEGRVR